MNFVLIFLFIIFVLEIIILGLILSSVIINIDNLEIETKNNKIYVDGMIIKVDLKLYRVLKILSIKFYMHYFKIWGIKIYYRKALKYENRKQLGEKIYEFFKKHKIEIKSINPEVEYFKFNLNFGTEDVIITSILTAILSGTITFILRKYVKKYEEENYNFKIIPNYFNTNNFNMKFKSRINLKMIEVIGKI